VSLRHFDASATISTGKLSVGMLRASIGRVVEEKAIEKKDSSLRSE